jgi:hypothetical protein
MIMEEKNNWMMMTGWSSDQNQGSNPHQETDNLLSMSLSMFGEDLFPSQDPIDQFFKDMQHDEEFSAGILDSLIGDNHEEDDEELDAGGDFETSSQLSAFLDQSVQELFGSDILSFGMNSGRRSPSAKKRGKKNRSKKIHLHSLEVDIEVDIANSKRTRKGSGNSSTMCTPSSSVANSPVMKSLLRDNKDVNASSMMKRLNKKMQDRSMGWKLKKQKKKKQGVSLLAKPSPKQHNKSHVVSSSSSLLDRRVLGSSNGITNNSDQELMMMTVRRRGISETEYHDHCLAMQEEVVLSSSPSSSPRSTHSCSIDLNNNNCSNKGRSWTSSFDKEVDKKICDRSPLSSSSSSLPYSSCQATVVLECQDHDYCPVIVTNNDPFLVSP